MRRRWVFGFVWGLFVFTLPLVDVFCVMSDYTCHLEYGRVAHNTELSMGMIEKKRVSEHMVSMWILDDDSLYFICPLWLICDHPDWLYLFIFKHCVQNNAWYKLFIVYVIKKKSRKKQTSSILLRFDWLFHCPNWTGSRYTPTASGLCIINTS